MRYENAVVVPLATARLIRLVTEDDLGEDMIRVPLAKKAAVSESKFWTMVSESTQCPFCSGYWLGVLVLATVPLTRVRGIGPLVRLGLRSLALNYVAGHAVALLDADE